MEIIEVHRQKMLNNLMKTSLARSSGALMVLCAGSLLMLASQAQAGQWVFSCEPASGTSSGTYSLLPGDPSQMPPISETFSFDWPSNKYTDPNDDYKTKFPWFPWLRNTAPIGAGARGSSGADSSIGAGKAAVTGDVKVVATWTLKAGESTPGPVPPSLNVLVSASTQAAACNSYDPSNAAVAAQRDASGEDGKADVTVDGAQAAKSSSVTAGSSGWKAGAARLFNLKTNGQSRVDVTTVNLSAQGNIPDGRSFYSYPNANNPNIPQSQWYTTKLTIALRGFVNASGSVTVASDSREVYLTRGSLVPKIEGAPGVTIDKAHDEWREADGTGHGHTTYSYNWVGIGEQFNFQNFQASRGGTWTWKTNPQGTGNIPNVSWSWDPVGSDPADADLSSRQMMRFGSPNKVGQEWQGTPTGTDTRTITYSATDKGDGTKGTAKYNLTLHDEWDAATDDTPSETHETRSIDLNVARIDGPQKDETWTFSKITAGLTAELKTTFGADFKLSDWLNAGGSFETTAKLEIESSYEAKSPLLQLAAGESAVPCVNYIVKTRHKLFDHWTASGWDKDNARADGKWPQDADLPVPIGDISANWHKLTTGKPLP